jgi:hypothetical protein
MFPLLWTSIPMRWENEYGMVAAVSDGLGIGSTPRDLLCFCVLITSELMTTPLLLYGSSNSQAENHAMALTVIW